MKLLQINTADGRGASGGIPEALHQMALKRDIYARIVIGRGDSSPLRVRVGDMASMGMHLLATRFFDRHGLHSHRATHALINHIERFDPDIIHLHNIHGYYLHYPTLMDYIRQCGRPVVWTLHDCWPFTGHCPFPVAADCSRWVDGCHDCPLRRQYPTSWFADRSRANYEQKRAAFSGLDNVTLVPVGSWLDSMLGRSFLGYLPRRIVRNGIDLNTFRPAAPKAREPIVLGIASKWDDRKGLQDFLRMRNYLPEHWRLRLIGLTDKQLAAIRKTGNIEGTGRISDPSEIAINYSRAFVYVNPTKGEGDNITKMEALACGTPVITYDAGGAAEGISDCCGAVVPPGRFDLLIDAILRCDVDPARCRAVAEQKFDMRSNLEGYFRLYDELIAKRPPSL